jgi:putative transposase
MRGEQVVRVLERLRHTRGLPEVIRVDNGSEFISKVMDKWGYDNHVKLSFSRPGKPVDNALIESFNGSFKGQMPQCELVPVNPGRPAKNRSMAQGLQ